MIGRILPDRKPDCFRKRKFQDDLPGFVGHFDPGGQQAGLFAFGKQIQDRRTCDFPSMVRVSQNSAFGIDNKVITNASIEKIARHVGFPGA
jgi:hypothetical protein